MWPQNLHADSTHQAPVDANKQIQERNIQEMTFFPICDPQFYMQKTTHQAPVDASPRDHDSLDAVDDRPEAAQGGTPEREVVHRVVVPLARGGVLGIV